MGYINVFKCDEKAFKKMKIDKKLIKELVENLKEFELTELRISRWSN